MKLRVGSKVVGMSLGLGTDGKENFNYSIKCQRFYDGKSNLNRVFLPISTRRFAQNFSFLLAQPPRQTNELNFEISNTTHKLLSAI